MEGSRSVIKKLQYSRNQGFSSFFSCLWKDPDPDPYNKLRIQIRIQEAKNIRILRIRMRSVTDPDPDPGGQKHTDPTYPDAVWKTGFK
jgi:hypothetical protein